MQSRQCLANGRAVVRTWPPHPQSIKKRDYRGRSAGHLAKDAAALVLYRLRRSYAASRQMLHQAQKKWKIVFSDPLFIQRQNEIAGAGVHQKIRVLDTLRDALVGEQFADVISGQKAGEIFRRNSGTDRHTASLRCLVWSQWTRQRKKHPLLRRRDGPDVERVTFGEGPHDFLDQHFWRRGAGSDAEASHVLKIVPINVAGALHEKCPRTARFLRHFLEALRVR